MRVIPSVSMFVLIASTVISGCTGADSENSGSGGAVSATTTTTVGGNASVGGAAFSAATGGVTSPQTLPSNGGAVSTSTNAGTATGNGGTASTSGTPPKGGSSAAGGSTAKGGSTTKGGTSAKGGSSSVGGTSTSTKAVGGTSSAGGSVSKGGTTSSGGTATFKCNNLSFAPSTSGKAKPTGTAGGLKVLDWAGFSSAISYTFDDANSSQINNYAAMKAAGGHYTFYLITGKSEAGNAVYKTAVQDGHEMGNHTSDHSNCNSGSTIDAANTFIKSTFGTTAYAFAAPNGAAACNTDSVSNKFLTNRSVNGGSMGPGDTSGLAWLPSDIASATNMAPAAGKWKTICIHGFTGGSDGAYQPIALDSFTSAVKAAVSGGSWVETVTNVAAYQVGQKLLSGKTGSTTWTLPSVFPPNMCVRATTTGGTVKQNGVEVPWNDHGYYEISLDAKSITIE